MQSPQPTPVSSEQPLTPDKTGKCAECLEGIPCGIISVLAVILSPIFFQAQRKAEATQCFTNTKQLAHGTLLYAADYDGVFPNNAASLRTLLAPYVKNVKSFTCPLDPPGVNSYTFNSSIAGMSMKAFTSPDKTVLIYEGNAGKLNYRHDGRASVVFVDGHGKLIRPEQADSLIWTVQVPKTKPL